MPLFSCGTACIAENSCANGIGNIPSEPTQMLAVLKEAGLADQDCTDYECDPRQNAPDGSNPACESFGCGTCDLQMIVCREPR